MDRRAALPPPARPWAARAVFGAAGRAASGGSGGGGPAETSGSEMQRLAGASLRAPGARPALSSRVPRSGRVNSTVAEKSSLSVASWEGEGSTTLFLLLIVFFCTLNALNVSFPTGTFRESDSS